MSNTQTDLSIVVPVYNEERNIPPLHVRITSALASLDLAYEVIYVDDGSIDGSYGELEALAETDPRVHVIRFQRNFGQTAALYAGVSRALGDTLVVLDADLQNDPKDIGMLLAKLDEGYDVVSGWRKDRKDNRLTRTLPSNIANTIISRVTGVHLHDYGCSLKAYRRSVYENFRLYGEMHRFLPAYAAQFGARVTELPVTHHPRIHGTSKYNLSKTFNVIIDLCTVKFLSKFGTRPNHLFGKLGMVLILLSFLQILYLLYLKFIEGYSMIQSPVLLMAAMFFILGVQSVFLGFVAELMVRTYHESQDKPPYVIKSEIPAARCRATATDTPADQPGGRTHVRHMRLRGQRLAA